MLSHDMHTLGDLSLPLAACSQWSLIVRCWYDQVERIRDGWISTGSNRSLLQKIACSVWHSYVSYHETAAAAVPLVLSTLYAFLESQVPID